jgi:hypothetical protein
MASIRVRFILDGGLVSWAIARVTGSLFSHVEFGTPQGTWIGAHIGDGIQERAADYCSPVREYVYEIPATPEQEQKALTWMRSQVGAKYDVLDIIGLLLQARSLQSPHRAICSQFYAEGMLLIFGPQRFLNVASGWEYRITPETGHLSPLLAGHLVKRVG